MTATPGLSEPAAVNKKVRNATPTVVDGVKYRSKNEAYTASLAKQLGIALDYEARRYELLPKFRYGGQAVRAITHCPDFTDPQERFILEVKGFANDTYPLYQKLLFAHLKANGKEPKFYLVTNQKQAQAALLDIKQAFYF